MPTIHHEVLRHAERAAAEEANGAPPAHGLTLIRNCSAALPPSIAERLEVALPGAAVLPTYAMTEALPICSQLRARANRRSAKTNFGSVGPAAGPQVGILRKGRVYEDATRSPTRLHLTGSSNGDGGGSGDHGSSRSAPDAEGTAGATGAWDAVGAEEAEEAEGEVVVRGRCVFGGYEAREHSAASEPAGSGGETDSFVVGGWLRTGDRGWLDGERCLHLTGRFKEIINRAVRGRRADREPCATALQPCTRVPALTVPAALLCRVGREDLTPCR